MRVRWLREACEVRSGSKGIGAGNWKPGLDPSCLASRPKTQGKGSRVNSVHTAAPENLRGQRSATPANKAVERAADSRLPNEDNY